MSDSKDWDLKQIGGGAGGGATLLFLLMQFQSQGIDMVTDKNMAEVNKRIEITAGQAQENARRITRNEKNVTELRQKIDTGFEKTNALLRAETNRITDIVRLSSSDRFTKNEQINFSNSIDSRINKIWDELRSVIKEVKRTK